MADEAGSRRGARDRLRIGLGVMARAPSSGGKTRLAPHLSEDRLRALRRALLADTLNVVNSRPLLLASGTSELPPSRLGATAGQVGVAGLPDERDGGEPIVFVEPSDACAEVEGLTDAPVVCVPQVEGDLGRRMRAAFTYLLNTLDYDAAILVGSDIPLLTPDHLREACEALTAARGVVLGPADDGGYYLIGMRTVHAELFDGVAWGTAGVLTDTLRIAERAGIEVRLVRAAYDLDTIEDLRRLEGDLRTAPPDIAPQVRAWFRAGGAGCT